LGRVFEREHSRLSLLRAKQDLEERVVERTRELTALNGLLQSEIASRESFQAALREAMDRYHSLMQSVRDVIFAVSARGRVESFNSAFDALTGLNWKDHVMQRVLPLIHREDRKAAAHAFLLTLAGEEVPPFELRIRHSRGEWVFIECSLTRQDRPGQPLSVTGIARDVTESRRSKAELVVRDRAIAATSEGIAITDSRMPGNLITFVNSGFERLTGYAAQDAIGKSLEELLRGPDTSAASTRRLEQAIAECQPVTLEMRAQRQDGQPFWARLVITPVRDGRNLPANFVAIVSDISRKRARSCAMRSHVSRAAWHDASNSALS